MTTQSSSSTSGGASEDRKVVVRYGVTERTVKVTPNMTVKEYREKFKNILNIPDNAKAYSGNQELDDNAVIAGKDGDAPVLEFIKKTGEKGV